MSKPNKFKKDGYTLKDLYALGYAEGYRDCRNKLLKEIKELTGIMNIKCASEECIEHNKWDKD